MNHYTVLLCATNENMRWLQFMGSLGELYSMCSDHILLPADTVNTIIFIGSLYGLCKLEQFKRLLNPQCVYCSFITYFTIVEL